MEIQLKNVIFYDGENEYTLDEIKEKKYFQNCYNYVSVLIKPVIDYINNSKSYVYIDTTKDKTEMFAMKNISDELSAKLKEFRIEY